MSLHGMTAVADEDSLVHMPERKRFIRLHCPFDEVAFGDVAEDICDRGIPIFVCVLHVLLVACGRRRLDFF